MNKDNIWKLSRKINLIIISITTIFLSSCALKQEKININPKLKVPNYNIGKKHEINIIVNDMRKNSNCNRQATTKSQQKSQIAVTDNFKTNIKSSISKALIKYNFKPTDKKSNRKLLINIMNLNYLQSSKYLVKGNIQINCEMQAIAINNKIKYEKIFKTQFTKKIVLTPLVTEDGDNINKVVSANIEKILADWSILNTIRS